MMSPQVGKRFCALPAVWVFFAVVSAASAQPWQSLFNGSDLKGWQPIGGAATNWSTADGVLTCNGQPGAQWLATAEQFSDFELALEFNVSPNGNSGVFVRAPRAGVPYVDGLEIQILDDYGEKSRDLKPSQFTGAIYAVVAPSKRATKRAGHWQAMVIRCVAERVQVTINGTRVVDAELSEYEDLATKIPGVKSRTGHIGLQNHGDSVSFRDLRIRSLDSD